MDIHRFVGMRTAGVLHRVRVDAQLMRTAEQRRAAELLPQHLGVHAPALRRRVVVARIHSRRSSWHFQAAPWTTRQIHPRSWAIGNAATRIPITMIQIALSKKYG